MDCCTLAAAAVTPMMVLCPPSRAHTQWGDASPVSKQIKRQCCGDTEVHFLPPGSVHARPLPA